MDLGFKPLIRGHPWFVPVPEKGRNRLILGVLKATGHEPLAKVGAGGVVEVVRVKGGVGDGEVEGLVLLGTCPKR